MLAPQGFVMIPGKNYWLVFDASFMLNINSRPFNHCINLSDKPEIIFWGGLPQVPDILVQPLHYLPKHQHPSF
jgi:hypothetical protein